MKDIARELRKWRKRNGLSQKKAALLAGVKQPTWCCWEVDMLPSLIRADTIERITSGAVTEEDLKRAHRERT